MPTPADDQELVRRQVALQAEGAEVLARLDLGSLFRDVGPVIVVGSYVSGLMTWRELDVELPAGAQFSPADVLDLLKPIVALAGFVGFTYRDERSDRSPTGEARDERYHVAVRPRCGAGTVAHRPVRLAPGPASERGRLA